MFVVSVNNLSKNKPNPVNKFLYIGAAMSLFGAMGFLVLGLDPSLSLGAKAITTLAWIGEGYGAFLVGGYVLTKIVKVVLSFGLNMLNSKIEKRTDVQIQPASFHVRDRVLQKTSQVSVPPSQDSHRMFPSGFASIAFLSSELSVADLCQEEFIKITQMPSETPDQKCKIVEALYEWNQRYPDIHECDGMLDVFIKKVFPAGPENYTYLRPEKREEEALRLLASYQEKLDEILRTQFKNPYQKWCLLKDLETLVRALPASDKCLQLHHKIVEIMNSHLRVYYFEKLIQIQDMPITNAREKSMALSQLKSMIQEMPSHPALDDVVQAASRFIEEIV